MSEYNREEVEVHGRKVICYSKPDTDFKCYIELPDILEIYPASKESTLNRYYFKWLKEQETNK